MPDDGLYDVFVNSLCFVWRPCKNPDAILKDLKSHPEAYIRYGGMSTGFSFYIEKASVDVQKYAPPEYVIAVRKIVHGDNGMINEYHREDIYEDSILRFAYDYTTRNMFVEKKMRMAI